MLMLVLSGKVAVHGARAQDRQVPPDMPRFETEIVVTPERGEAPRALVSASTVVMDASSLVELPIVHPSEVLSFLPGLSVVRSQFHVTRPVVSARGFFGGGEAEYVLLLVDGLPVADVESGLIDWSSIPVSSIRRIEVARGPGASVYGDSAVGGVIQILTDRYATGGTLTSAAGSFDTFTGDGSYRRRWEQFGLSVSGAARRTGGAFEHSGGHELVGAAAADGARGRFSWRWMVNGHDRHRDDPGFLSRDQLVTDPFGSDPLFRFDELTRHGFSTAVILRHDIPVGRPHARIYASARDENLIRSILLTPGVGDRRARTLSSLTIGASLEGEQTFASAHPLTVRFGLDVSREQLDTSYYSVDENGVVGTLDTEASGYRLRTGLFVSASWAPVERVRVSGAVRWDDISDIGFGGPSSAGATPQRAWSPRMGVVFQRERYGRSGRICTGCASVQGADTRPAV